MTHLRLVEAEHLQAPLYEPAPEPWSLLRRVVLGIAACVLLWTILIFAIIGFVAVFGSSTAKPAIPIIGETR